MIGIEDLTKVYEGVRAADAIDLAIGKSEVSISRCPDGLRWSRLQ